MLNYLAKSIDFQSRIQGDERTGSLISPSHITKHIANRQYNNNLHIRYLSNLYSISLLRHTCTTAKSHPVLSLPTYLIQPQPKKRAWRVALCRLQPSAAKGPISFQPSRHQRNGSCFVRIRRRKNIQDSHFFTILTYLPTCASTYSTYSYSSSSHAFGEERAKSQIIPLPPNTARA